MLSNNIRSEKMPKKITAILGDFYHQPDVAIQSLEAAIKSLAFDVKVDYLSFDDLANNLENHPDLVVLFAENRINPEDDEIHTWMDEEVADQINTYIQHGGSWLAWHSGLASYENVKSYTEILKGHFI